MKQFCYQEFSDAGAPSESINETIKELLLHDDNAYFYRALLDGDVSSFAIHAWRTKMINDIENEVNEP